MQKDRSKMNIVIRSYTSADLEACRMLWAELTAHHRTIYDDPTIGGEQPGVYFDAHLSRVGPNRIWVAEINGTVCGFVGLIVEGEEAEIEPLVVSETHRGKGIGQQLLARARQEAESIWVRFLKVKPVARNVDAIGFFYQAGFRLLGSVELFMELSSATDHSWKEGITLHSYRFEY